MKIVKLLPFYFILAPLYSNEVNIPEHHNELSVYCVTQGNSLMPFLRAQKDPIPYEIHHPAIDNKKTILSCAQLARQYANQHLEEAERLVGKLKKVEDWRLRDRLKTFIGSAISTTLIPEPRLKFLTVALAMFTDLVINEGLEKTEICYKIYQELSLAAACLDEYKYFSRLSLRSSDSENLYDYGFQYASFCIEHLTIADMLTCSLEYKLHGGVVSSYITDLRNFIINDLVDHRRLTYSYQSHIENCLENFDEIVADCSSRDRYLVDKIRFEIESALDDLRMAESEWGIKHKKNRR